MNSRIVNREFTIKTWRCRQRFLSSCLTFLFFCLLLFPCNAEPLKTAAIDEAGELAYGCFVDRLYLDFLGRSAESGGYNFYIDELSSGTMTPEEVTRNFIISPEFNGNRGFINRCYFALFNNNSLVDYSTPGYRYPDYGGLLFWSQAMNDVIDAGGTLEEAKLYVILGFTGSPEWQDRIGQQTDAEFVHFLYEHILGRSADVGGHAYHLDNLEQGRITREELVRQFLDSPEAVAKYENHTYVVMSYIGLIDRVPDPGGFVYHMGNLVLGLDPVAHLGNFIYAPEYIDRLAALGCGFMQPLTTITVGKRNYHDFNTIQGAIDAAVDGDEIVVHPGTFVENINFLGKNIILRSTDPHDWEVVEATVIDGDENGSVVTFSGSELSTCTLSGFTITNGLASIGGGGGIRGNDSHALIDYCVVTGNRGSDKGGGLLDCDGIINSNHITNNIVSAFMHSQGGGLHGCDGVIQNNIISRNEAFSTFTYGAAHGGGLAECNGIIRNNTIFDNDVLAFNAEGSGLYNCLGEIINNIIWECRIYDSATPSYCCIQTWTGGGDGNINLDPLFIASVNSNFHLQSNSPCIDTGVNVMMSHDLDGNSRPLDGDSMGAGTTGDGSDYDIGAYEFKR